MLPFHPLPSHSNNKMEMKMWRNWDTGEGCPAQGRCRNTALTGFEAFCLQLMFYTCNIWCLSVSSLRDRIKSDSPPTES